MYSIIVVSHGHEKYFAKQIDSLVAYFKFPFEVILIDNFGDGKFFKEFMQLRGIDHRVLVNIKSRGFSINNNIGVSAAKYEQIFLLNPDAWLEDETLSNFLKKSDLRNDIAYFPKLFNLDGSPQLHCKAKPNLINQLVTVVYSLLHIKRSSPSGDYWCMAAALLITRELYYKVQGFDEGFELYAEDTELCDRLRKLGYGINILNEVRVFHLLHDNSKNRYLWRAIKSNFYYRYKSIINSLK